MLNDKEYIAELENLVNKSFVLMEKRKSGVLMQSEYERYKTEYETIKRLYLNDTIFRDLSEKNEATKIYNQLIADPDGIDALVKV